MNFTDENSVDDDVVDISDTEDDVSVNNPDWLTDSEVASLTTVDEDSPTEVRTTTGALDFITDIVEDTISFLSFDEAPPSREEDNKPVSVKIAPAQKWRGRTAQVDANCNKLFAEATHRRRLKITNQGANAVYLSSASCVNTGQPNQYVLAPAVPASGIYPSVVIESSDDVYAMCALTQTSTLGVIEEFDL